MKKLRLSLCGIILIPLFCFSLVVVTYASDALDFQGTITQKNTDTLLADPAQGKSAPITRASTNSALHLEFGIQYLQYDNMAEPYQFNPASDLMLISTVGWEHTWQEERAWLRTRYDLLNSEHVLLQPGLLLGAVRGQFKANNAALHFSEEWQTKPALLWGLLFAGEVRANQQHGPFLKVQYLYSRAEAREEHETVTSDSPGTSGDNRDARFLWHESKMFLGVGYRWETLIPIAGISYTDFRLQKLLQYHIPEAGLSGTDLQVARTLNSEESEYDFRTDHPWAPFLSLEWSLAPEWTIVATSTFPPNEDLSLALQMSF